MRRSNAIVIVWLFSDWFAGVFDTLMWPLLGFFFAPTTLLWYSVVENLYNGYWGTLQIVVLVVAVAVGAFGLEGLDVAEDEPGAVGRLVDRDGPAVGLGDGPDDGESGRLAEEGERRRRGDCSGQ